MAAVLQPWQIFLAALAGWISREEDAVIEYLREENRALEQQLGRRRLRLTDDPPADHGSWESSPVWWSEWRERIHDGDTHESEVR